MKKKTNKRALVSIIMLIAFGLLVITAVGMEITEIDIDTLIHDGMIRVEDIPDSFARHLFTFTHILAGIIFTIAGMYHVVFNRKPLMSYLKM